ncbi:hypothetical protein C2S53_000960 [Perilla frutescens var. hirtella]|uniref:NAC domain-containing protein n=1 Tax=Perilla frutescens var. hirtella TaxID=608512 RepID=A0AAD4JQG2_PERFH|nr:hypothetical protein C2S53_000960 [Perilla frutescens var. hirtella]
MNNQEESNDSRQDEHEHDVVMPGFRFHPTEEELVEFYLRRKVEGKHFNVELITSLDLYRYDPWELPALAAIGEKEWYFYVPRHRKYRNGDRPNRVTTSGYWKATGADRMIRSENHHRSIGLKKTLVFYSGKAPKGSRTTWIMNEYRLPLHETERLQKAEISLCRVYKRAGVEDQPSSLPRSLHTRASSSSSSRSSQPSRRLQATHGGSTEAKMSDVTSASSSTDIGYSTPINHSSNYTFLHHPLVPAASTLIPAASASVEDDHTLALLQSNNSTYLIPNLTTTFAATSSHALDDLHKLVNIDFQQQDNATSSSANHVHYPNVTAATDFLSYFPTLQPQPPQAAAAVAPNIIPGGLDRLMWDWNTISEASKDFTNLFK